MKNLAHICFSAAVSLILMAAIGAGSASATTLSISGVKQSGSVSISASLSPGTSMVLKDSAGTTTDTCTASTLQEKTESPFTGSQVAGNASSLTYTNCSHTTHVLSRGRTIFIWIPGTNRATVFSVGTEVQVQSTFFGVNAVCKTGGGTHIGTLTGVFFGKTKMDYNATINCGILGNSSLSGEYTITSPEGLAVVE